MQIKYVLRARFLQRGVLPFKLLLLLLLGNQPSINGGRPVHKQANAQAGLTRISGPSSYPLFSDSHMVCIIEIQCVYHIS